MTRAEKIEAGALPERPASARLRLGLRVLVSVALMGLLFSRVALGEVAALIRRADPLFVGLCLAAFAASLVGSAAQWWLFLRVQGIRLGFGKVFGFYMVGLFFNNFLPANLGGDVVKVIDVCRAGGSRGGAITATLMDRAMGLLLLVVAAIGAAWMLRDDFPFPELAAPLYVATAGLTLFFAMILSGRALAAVTALARRIPIRWLADRLVGALAHIEPFHANRAVFLATFVISAITQALRIAVHYLAASALGLSVAPVLFFLVVPAIAVAVSVPISIGGFGVREGLGVLLFGRVGVGTPEAFTFELLSHLVAVAISVTGGIWFAIRKRESRV